MVQKPASSQGTVPYNGIEVKDWPAFKAALKTLCTNIMRVGEDKGAFSIDAIAAGGQSQW